MKNFFKTLLLGICAGIAISLGGCLFLFCKSYSQPILGGFLFSIGLLLVCSLGFYLYTGKIGYCLANKKDFAISLLVMYLGNFIGALGFGYLMRLISMGGNNVLEVAETIGASKLLYAGEGGKNWYTLIISGILCGILVFIAVDSFKYEKFHIILRILILVCAVATFIILGFDHCIANMFYFSFANNFFSNDWWRALVSILLVTIGNSIGAIITYLVIYKLIRKE